MSSLSGEESSEDEDQSSEDEDDDDEEDIIPPPPPKNTSSTPPAPASTSTPTLITPIEVVTHLRHYSEEYKLHYYVLASDPGGESDWVPPTTGVVHCTDEATGRVFYTQSATGKTAWDLNGF